MALETLIQTSVPAAEVILGQLKEDGIEAQILDRPTFLVRGAAACRVRVVVAEEDLERARGSLARREPAAEERIRVLVRPVLLQLLLGSIPAIAFAVGGTLLDPSWKGDWPVALVLVWFLGLIGSAFLWRLRARRAK